MKCILWDFDNTLAYRDGMWTKSLCNVLIENGYEEDKYDVISSMFSTGFTWQRHSEAHEDYFNGLDWWGYTNTLISNALNEIGIVDPLENKRLTEQFKDEYLREDAWHLYDDTIHNLKMSHKKGYCNIILSNHVPELSILVKRLGISKFFEYIINSALVGYEKPHTKIFEEAFKLKKEHSLVMVGDNYKADVMGALNSGIDAILVRKENIHNYPKYSKDLNGIWKFIKD